jgi:hypothetical protein
LDAMVSRSRCFKRFGVFILFITSQEKLNSCRAHLF